MKIAILSFYSGIHKRGVERWTHELALRLSSNHEICVYQAGNINTKAKYKVVKLDTRYDPDKEELLFPFQKRAFLDYKGKLIGKFTLRSLPALWKENFDIIIPTDGGWEPALIRILTWLRRTKMVIVGHSGVGWDDRNNLWTFPNCFVALTSSMQKWASRVVPFVKMTIIPDGVDLRAFSPKGKKAKIALPKPIVLLVGAIEDSKRISLAIKAVKKMGRGSLMVLGKGSKEDEIRSLAKRELEDKFLMKSVSFNEMSNYYRAADIFTLPSWKHEAFGMVYIEAMACGLPVVATKDSSRTEIVGGAGILVDPTNTDEYAKALERASVTNWGNKPRKQAEKFSWDKVVEKYEKLFEDLTR